VRSFAGFMRDPLGFMLHIAEEYGDVAAMPQGPRPAQRWFIIVSHPDLVGEVLQSGSDRYRKAFTYEPLRRVLGDGLLTSEGDRWLQHRRLAQPFFRASAVRDLVGDFAAATERLCRRWDDLADDGAQIDVGAEMRRLTLDIVGRSLFGVDLSQTAGDVGRAMAVLQRLAFRQVLSPRTWMGWTSLPQRTSRRHAEAIAGLNRVVDRLIAERRHNPQDFDDLLAGLMAAAEAEGTSLTNSELRDQLVTFLAAGHETTAHALTWTWYLLGRNPEARRRLVAEADAVLTGAAPTAETIDKLHYTEAVISESLRLYPPAWTIERDAVADDSLGGYTVPAGATVVTSPWVLHRRSTLWDDPLAFDPDRFLDHRTAQRHRFAYLPFGAGRRQCIGAGFAMLEATTALALLAQRYRLELAPDQHVEPDPRITLGLRVALRARVVMRETPAGPGPTGP
jgi:cytochrome P450